MKRRTAILTGAVLSVAALAATYFSTSAAVPQPSGLFAQSTPLCPPDSDRCHGGGSGR